MGKQPDRQIVWSMQRFQLLLPPGNEDFGTTEVEAWITGGPVHAANGAGTVETVQDEQTGLPVSIGEIDAR